ncbi:MAG: InlB B-repeat-containing protein [Candidatus Azobacteroides sp.]|nr:InlB B-repeat-containing protein [Candidatus Azobacteroides sp.]
MKKTIFSLLLTTFFAFGVTSVIHAQSVCDVVFDFEDGTVPSCVNQTAVSCDNPYTSGINTSNKALQVTCTNNYNFKGIYFPVTIPDGKTFADIYTTITFQVAVVGNSLNGKSTLIGVSDNGTTWSNTYDGAPSDNFAKTWVTRTISVSNLNATIKGKTGTFYLGIGIKNEEAANDYYLDNIALVADPDNCITNQYTATLNPGTGTCAVPRVSETAEGSGVTLPAASPSAKCTVAGYTFAGWSESAVTETTTTPALVPTAYFPTANITLYAVYTDGTVYNSNPTCSVSLNGTVTNGWLMVEDFENNSVNDPLTLCNYLGGTIVGSAKVVANPTISGENVANVITTDGSYNSILQLNVTLPAGKVLADYSNISFKLYRNTNDANYKQMMVMADNEQIYFDGATNYPQQAPATTWTTKTYAIDPTVMTGNTFDLKLGIKTNAGDYLIDDVQLQERPITVILNPCGGTVTPTSVAQASPGAAVTLPAASPSTESAGAGWSFAGWAVSEVQNTTVAPSFASSTYTPTGKITLYAVYTNGTNYDSYPTTSVSADGTTDADGWLMVEDFEGKAVNTPVNLYNTFGQPIIGSASVCLDPANANERAVHILTGDYNTILQLDVTLPAGKTLADYKQIAFDFYSKIVETKNMLIYIDGAQIYADTGYPSQGAAGQWNNKVYNLSSGSAAPRLKATSGTTSIAVGISTPTGDYYIDNIKLLEAGPLTGLKDLNDEIALYYTGNTLFTSQPANVLIYNLTGQVLISGKNVSETDLSNLSSGIYVAKASIDGKQVVKKIVKQ